MYTSVPISKVCKAPRKLSVKNTKHWKQEQWRQQRYEVHKNTETIFLRFRDKNKQGVINDYPLMDVYRSDVDTCLDTLKQHYKFDDYCVIISNLLSGEQIYPHVDNNRTRYFQNSHRVHLPIKTNPDVLFTCGDETISMEEGWFYEIDNTNCVHSVANNSPYDRYHYIFDLFAT